MAKLFPGFIALGYVPFTEDPIENLKRMVLPVFALSLPMIANLSRLVRSAMLDALSQQYIRTAKAKGVSNFSIIYKHALRNALIPYITSVGVSVGYLLGGSIVVEQVFAIPGLGRFYVEAAFNRDYTMILGSSIFFSCLIIGLNLVSDLIAAAINPKLR